MSFVENESPMPNMRKTMPSWPTIFVEPESIRNSPPHVYSLIRMPARMYPITLGQPRRAKTTATRPAIDISTASDHPHLRVEIALDHPPEEVRLLQENALQRLAALLAEVDRPLPVLPAEEPVAVGVEVIVRH